MRNGIPLGKTEDECSWLCIRCSAGSTAGCLLLFSSRKVETWLWARMRAFNRHEVGQGYSIR